MLINITLVDSTETEITLNKEITHKNEIIWKGFIDGNLDPDYQIMITVGEDNNIKSIEKGSQILTSEGDIKEYFLSNLLEIKGEELEDEISGIESIGEETGTFEEPRPYDPELIRVDTKNINLSYVYDMMMSEHRDLDLSPDFQRNFVWTDITRKSRLIESILLRIPLPVFYLSQDEEGRLQVIDGVQRLNVIKAFLSNEFKLKNLEYLKDCEGCYFDKGSKILDSKYLRRIKQTQLIFNIIDPQTPYKVKFEIFKRINTGGKPLNYQEVRNCLANSSVRHLLKELSTSQEFRLATDGSVSSIRMADQELIMRYIGFYYSIILNNEELKYKGDMNQFLDETLELLNGETRKMMAQIKNSFLESMNSCYHLFGEYSFRKCTMKHLEPSEKKQLINKSLFTSISVLLSVYRYQDIQSKNEFRKLVEPLAQLMDKDTDFFNSISIGTSDRRRIDKTFVTVNQLIQTYVKV